MKSIIFKPTLMISLFLNCMSISAQAQASDPLQEGITPVVISPGEQEELNAYVNNVETGLQRAIRLSNAAYSHNRDSDRDGRIEIYIDTIRKIVPESALDIVNQTAPLMRVALNQGMLIDSSMRNQSFFTHEFREHAMLFAMQEAMKFYKTDLELLKKQVDLSNDYMSYAVDLAQFVINDNGYLNKSAAAVYYHEVSQLLVNVIMAKGNTHKLLFASEVLQLQDILEKTDPNNHILDNDKKKVVYASTSFADTVNKLNQKVNGDQNVQSNRNAINTADSSIGIGNSVYLHGYSGKVVAVGADGSLTLRFDADGSIASGYKSSQLAVPKGCSQGICVNDVVYQYSDLATVVAIRAGGLYTVRYQTDGSVGYDLSRDKLAVTK